MSNAKDARTCSHVQAHPSAIPQKPHHSIRWDICEPAPGLVWSQASLTGNLEGHIIGKSDHEASIHTTLGAGSELLFTRDISDGAGRGRERERAANIEAV